MERGSIVVKKVMVMVRSWVVHCTLRIHCQAQKSVRIVRMTLVAQSVPPALKMTATTALA